MPADQQIVADRLGWVVGRRAQGVDRQLVQVGSVLVQVGSVLVQVGSVLVQVGSVLERKTSLACVGRTDIVTGRAFPT